MNTILHSALVAASLLVFAGCAGGGNTNNNGENSDNDGYKSGEMVQINYADYGLDQDFINRYDSLNIADIGDMIQSFPSPVEMAAIIQNMNVPYRTKYLFPKDAAKNFETNFKKALGLGVYCADLGYLNVYNQSRDVIDYLVNIRQLSDQLKIGQFFDFSTLKNIATNSDNLDSLLILSVQSYFNMDAYLRQNDRSNLSALMVTGVWLESLYLACDVYQEKQNKQLKDFIASQKPILANLLGVLVKFIKSDPDYVKLVANLKDLVNAMENITIETIEGEDQHEIVDGQSITTQGEHTEITVSDEQMMQIVKVTQNIRKKIAEQL